MIIEIQYLRAVAALMVVLFHSVWQLYRMNYAGPDVSMLSAGVDIFFIISGFVMVYISGQRTMTPASFMRDRIFRIVPLYWILTLFIAAVGVLVPSVLQSSAFDPGHLLASLAFLPAVHPVNGGIFPTLQLGWTLNYEMYFYVIFAACLLLPDRARIAGVLGALAALTVLFSLGSGTTSAFYANPIVFEFGFGVVLGWLYRSHPGLFAVGRPGSAALLGLIAGFLLLGLGYALWPEVPRLVRVGLPSLLIVAATLVAAGGPRRRVWPFGVLVGDASYSLYLSHTITLSALGQLARRLVGETPGLAFHLLFMAAAVVICVAVALLVHRHIDVPLQRRLRSLKRSGRHVSDRQALATPAGE